MMSPSKTGLSRRGSPDFGGDGPTMPLVVGDLKTMNKESQNSSGSQAGEFHVTLASALLLFAHFGITLYKIERNHPETSIAKKHLKDRWLLINLCIAVFALASHLYRNALNNMKIKNAVAILVPDVVTAGVIFLILTKHIYFALYLLMAGVTFLSIAVTFCDIFTYFKSFQADEGDQLSVAYKKEYDELDDSIRSSTSTISMSSSFSVRSRLGSSSGIAEVTGNLTNTVRDNSEALVKSLANGFRNLANNVPTSPRKKATRSVLRKPPKKHLWETA